MAPFKPEQDPEALRGRFGERLFRPPQSVEGEFRAVLKESREAAQVGLRLGLAVAVGGAAAGVLVSPVLGGLLILGGAVVLVQSAGQAGRTVERGAPLAVFERGVLVPHSFRSAPGLETVGGPAAFAAQEIERAEYIESKEERAVVVWSRRGEGGLADRRLGPVTLDGARAREVLDGFAASLESIGVKLERREDLPPPPQDNGAPPAASAT